MNPYLIIGVLVGALALFGVGVKTGKNLEASSWQKEKLEMQTKAAQTLQAAVDNNRKIQLDNEAKARKASNDYQLASQKLASDYAANINAMRASGGLRIDRNSVCSNATSPNQSASTSGLNEASTPTVELPERAESRLFAMSKRGDDLAEQLRSLQEWVKDNGFYGEIAQ